MHQILFGNRMIQKGQRWLLALKRRDLCEPPRVLETPMRGGEGTIRCLVTVISPTADQNPLVMPTTDGRESEPWAAHTTAQRCLMPSRCLLGGLHSGHSWPWELRSKLSHRVPFALESDEDRAQLRPKRRPLADSVGFWAPSQPHRQSLWVWSPERCLLHELALKLENQCPLGQTRPSALPCMYSGAGARTLPPASDPAASSSAHCWEASYSPLGGTSPSGAATDAPAQRPRGVTVRSGRHQQ